MKAPLNPCFAPHSFLDSWTLKTKTGALGLVYRLPGIDPECWTDESLEELAQQQLHPALRSLDPDFRIYQYVLKEKGVDLPYHRASELYSIELYWTLLLERALGGIARRVLSESPNVSLERLHGSAEAFENATAHFLRLERLERADAFHFLRRLSNLTREVAHAHELAYLDHLDYWICQNSITIDGRQLWIGRPTAVLTLRELPKATYPNILGRLTDIDCDFILCSEFKRIPTLRAVDMLTAKQDFFHESRFSKNTKSAVKQMRQGGSGEGIVADASAAQNVTDLGQTLIRVQNGGEFLGDYSLTMVLHAPTTAALHKAIAEATQRVGAMEGELKLERFPLDPYLAIIPGGKAVRSHPLTSANYADLSQIYAPMKGDPINAHLKAEYLTIFETRQKTAIYFNLHDDDLLGALIWGVMGSGKSFLVNLLIHHLYDKYKPFIFILDLGNSYKHTTRLLKGSYITLAAGGSYAFNPFVLQRTPANLEFLSVFVHTLLEEAGYRPTPQDTLRIDKAIATATRLSDLDLPEHLKEALHNWIGEGRYANYFDNERDSFEKNDLQCFEFRGVPKKALGPLFLYLFHRISSIVHDEQHFNRLKVMVCDENWKFLRSRTGREYFVEAGKTWRKDNGGIVLTTQSALDLNKVRMLDAILEICTTTILLHNPGSNRAFYRRKLNLNDQEINLVAGLTKKRQAFVKTPSYSKVVEIRVDQADYWRYANDPNSNLIRLAAQKEYGEEEGIRRLAKGA